MQTYLVANWLRCCGRLAATDFTPFPLVEWTLPRRDPAAASRGLVGFTYPLTWKIAMPKTISSEPKLVSSYFRPELALKDVVELLEHPLCWSFSCYRIGDVTRGRYTYTDHFDIFADDVVRNHRVVIRVKFGYCSTYIDATGLTDYDDVKVCWNTELGCRRTEIESKRGRKVLEQWRVNLWESRSSWRSNGSVSKFSATKHNGIWDIYGC
jgi:hypothetical protein